MNHRKSHRESQEVQDKKVDTLLRNAAVSSGNQLAHVIAVQTARAPSTDMQESARERRRLRESQRHSSSTPYPV